MVCGWVNRFIIAHYTSSKGKMVRAIAILMASKSNQACTVHHLEYKKGIFLTQKMIKERNKYYRYQQ